MLTYDLRSLVRRYVWILPMALVSFCFYTELLQGVLTPRIPISMALPLLGPSRTIYSLGEWGRSILLSLELFLSIPLSALIGLLIAQPLSDELEHGNVLASTPRAALVPVSLLVAATTLSWLCLILGGSVAFLNPLVRMQINPAGWVWLPLLLVLAWLRIALWSATCALALYLTGSKWMAVASVPLIQMVWFGLGAAGGRNLLATAHRGLLAWSFIGPYSNLGVGEVKLVTQGGMLFGLVILLMGLALWARSRHMPSSEGFSRFRWLLCFSGTTILIALLAANTLDVGRSIATPTSSASATAAGCPTQNTIWASDGRLVQMTGEYSALRLATDCGIPAWFASGDLGVQVRRFDDLGEISPPVGTRQAHGETFAGESLLLASPKERSAPNELKHRLEAYAERIEPAVAFASSWIPTPLSIVLIYPSDMLGFRPLVRVNADEIWIDEATMVRLDRKTEWESAWALAASLGLSGETTAYMALVLADRMDSGLAWEALEALDSIRTAERRTRWPYLSLGMHEAVREEGAAGGVLAMWDEGERLGHAQLVEQLMQRSRND